MVDTWYYKWEGMEYGPVTFDTLFHLAQAGAIVAESEVKQGEASDWVPANSLVGLIAAPPETVDDDIVVVEPSSEPPQDDVEFPMSHVVTPVADVDAQFYWRSFGQEFGPVPFETLHEMIQREELSAGDAIRIEAPDGWLPVGGLKDIAASFQPAAAADEFALQPGLDQPDSSANPFAELASTADLESAGADDIFDEVMSAPVASKTTAPTAPSTSTTPRQISAEAPAVTAQAPPVPASAPVMARPPMSPAATAAPKIAPPPRKPVRSGPKFDIGSMFSNIEFGPKLFVPIGLVVVVAAVWMFYPSGGPDLQDQIDFEQLVSFQQEFRNLRSTNAPPDQWEGLEVSAEANMASMIASLESRASPDRPIPQNLLIAVRDLLPKMLETSRKSPDENEQKFEKQMETIRKLIAGESVE